MWIRLLKTMIKQSGQSIKRSRNMSIASIGSVSATLLVLGIVLALVLNMTNITDKTKDDFDQVQAYVQLGLKENPTPSFKDQMLAIDGVESVEFVAKEQALEDMKSRLNDNEDILEGLEKNPFQNAYTVNLKDVEKADKVVEQIEKIEGIDDVLYQKGVIDKLVNVADVTRVAGLILIGILLVISIFIISNTIKTTVIARQTEIGIMKYVGATNGFIRGPFIIEGIVLGIIGAIISIVIVMFGYKYLIEIFNTSLNGMLSSYLVPTKAILNDVTIIFITLGAGVGALGSVISLRKFLKV